MFADKTNKKDKTKEAINTVINKLSRFQTT
jgi:hypothetical protein